MTRPQNDALQSLMLLPSQAKNRFQKAADENQQLEQISKAQNVIIDDLSYSIPELDNIQKNLNSTDEDLKDVEQQLKETQEMLLELLTTNNNSPKQDAGVILKAVLSNLQRTLTSICSQSASKGQIEVSLIGLIDLEDQIGKIIEDMSTRGIYPEDEKSTEERVQRMQLHNIKVVKFLQEIQASKGEQ